MHGSSREKIALVAELLAAQAADDASRKYKIVDIGGLEPSYRAIFEKYTCFEYTTMNVKFAASERCNICVEKAYDWQEIADETFDIIICGQVFEHVEYFWITLLEMRRILKHKGYLAIAAPSHWPEHRAPYDCYRFYGDGMYAMAKFIDLEIIYAFAEHKQFVNRENCDAILLAQKLSNDKSVQYKQAHRMLVDILPQNYTIEISRNKPTFQSSHSKWEDKKYCKILGNAVSGIHTGEYSFHTCNEENAWWFIDLEKIYPIAKIEVWNRKMLELRCKNIDIFISDDIQSWSLLHSNTATFGGTYDGKPLIIRPNNTATRYILIKNKDISPLHLDQVKVFSYM